jgi:hypothetical protein
MNNYVLFIEPVPKHKKRLGTVGCLAKRAVLSIGDVCASLKERGSFTGIPAKSRLESGTD